MLLLLLFESPFGWLSLSSNERRIALVTSLGPLGCVLSINRMTDSLDWATNKWRLVRDQRVMRSLPLLLLLLLVVLVAVVVVVVVVVYGMGKAAFQTPNLEDV